MNILQLRIHNIGYTEAEKLNFKNAYNMVSIKTATFEKVI